MPKKSDNEESLKFVPALGALKSPLDIRTFSYPAKAYDVHSGGEKYQPGDIEDQSKVGICTAIHITQNARKATGTKYSADFQYLIQKKFFDSKAPIGWGEGSSIFHAIKAASEYGFLPEKEWKHTTQKDRDAGYSRYVAKLKKVAEDEKEMERLLAIARQNKILKAYAKVPTDRDSMARAIDESKSGILARFVVGKEWYTDRNGRNSWAKEDLEPLRRPAKIISGHAVTESNFAGRSFRIANTWGPEWCDGGTGYHLLDDYGPTECWSVWYEDEELPKEIEKQLEDRKKVVGQITDLLQQVIALLAKLL